MVLMIKSIIHFMKRNYKIIIPIVILAGLLFSFQIINKPDPEKDKILIGLIRYALTFLPPFAGIIHIRF